MTIERVTGKRSLTRDAEGANLDQAKPDETLRQKDPVPLILWKVPHGTPTV
jgi:hypothetical protein